MLHLITENQMHCTIIPKKKPFCTGSHPGLDHALRGTPYPFPLILANGRSRVAGSILVETDILGILTDFDFLQQFRNNCTENSPKRKKLPLYLNHLGRCAPVLLDDHLL